MVQHTSCPQKPLLRLPWLTQYLFTKRCHMSAELTTSRRGWKLHTVLQEVQPAELGDKGVNTGARVRGYRSAVGQMCGGAGVILARQVAVLLVGPVEPRRKCRISEPPTHARKTLTHHNCRARDRGWSSCPWAGAGRASRNLCRCPRTGSGGPSHRVWGSSTCSGWRWCSRRSR